MSSKAIVSVAAAALGHIGGKSTSKAKADACKKNGAWVATPERPRRGWPKGVPRKGYKAKSRAETVSSIPVEQAAAILGHATTPKKSKSSAKNIRAAIARRHEPKEG